MAKLLVLRKAERTEVRAARSTLAAATVLVAIGVFPINSMARPVGTVLERTGISQGDPAVKIGLPESAQYVGTRRSLLSKPEYGNFESCEQLVFVEPDGGQRRHGSFIGRQAAKTRRRWRPLLLLAWHGHRRDDHIWVRLVHLTDAANRKELVIIYAESLKPTGYSAAQLDEGGTEYAKWAVIAESLVHRVERCIDIRPLMDSHRRVKQPLDTVH